MARGKRTDKQRLRLFCESVDKAINRRAVRDGTIAAAFHIEGGEDAHVTWSVSLGDDEDVRSLLVDVRRFLAPKEDVYFPGIANIVAMSVSDPELVNASAVNRESWADVLGRGPLNLYADGLQYTPARCFDIVVNGEMFHDDVAKQEEFRALQPMFRDFVLQTVNSVTIELLKVLQAERNVVVAAFERGAFADLPERKAPPVPEDGGEQ